MARVYLPLLGLSRFSFSSPSVCDSLASTSNGRCGHLSSCARRRVLRPSGRDQLSQALRRTLCLHLPDYLPQSPGRVFWPIGLQDLTSGRMVHRLEAVLTHLLLPSSLKAQGLSSFLYRRRESCWAEGLGLLSSFPSVTRLADTRLVLLASFLF